MTNEGTVKVNPKTFHCTKRMIKLAIPRTIQAKAACKIKDGIRLLAKFRQLYH